jgi:hypothetical protein
VPVGAQRVSRPGSPLSLVCRQCTDSKSSYSAYCEVLSSRKKCAYSVGLTEHGAEVSGAFLLQVC